MATFAQLRDKRLADYIGTLEYKIQLFPACKKLMQLAKTETVSKKKKRWNKIIQANGTCKQAGIASLISNKVDFKSKLVM
jgi:hypothetical protein